MQQPELCAAHDGRFRGPCELARLIGNQRDDRVELGVHPRDHRKVRIEHLDRAHGARLDQRGELAGGFSCQALVGHRSLGHLPDQCTNRRSTSMNNRLKP